MRLLSLLTLLACDEAASDTPEPAPVPAETTPVSGAVAVGPFTVTPVYHGTVRIDHKGTTFWIDPWSKGALADAPKADVILITDIHQDHLDEAAIDAVSKDGTVFVAPAAVSGKRAAPAEHILANGDTVEVAGISITAVPMYNLVRGPEEGTLFHDKGRGNGYILESDGTRLYFAGDTECTEEMKALTGIDAAFLPMNLPYTMPPEEAAACIAAFKPALAVPYHYAGSDLSEFTAALEGVTGVTVQLAEFYPGGLPW